MPAGNTGAVGLSHFVQMTAGLFHGFRKDGDQVQQMSDVTFWTNAGIIAGITSVGIAHPRVVYDWLSDRWFAVQINHPTGNQILLALEHQRSDGNLAGGELHGCAIKSIEFHEADNANT